MGLLPEFNTRIRALMAAAQSSGQDPRIVSGYRSEADQAKAINSVSQRVNGRPASFVEYSRGIPGLAAPVGASMHQRGEAVDFSPGPSLDWMRQNASAYGVRFPQSLAKSDPVHAEVDPDFWGPVQDPNDIGKTVTVPPSSQPDPAKTANYQPKRSGMSAAQPMMMLGGPKDAPTGGQPMALYDPQQQQQGFSLDNWVSSPLFQMGAGVLGAPNIGQGLMQGSAAASQFASARQKQQREAELFPLQKQLLQEQVRKAGQPPTTEDITEYNFAVKEAERLGLPPPRFDAFVAKKRDKGFGLNPIMGIGPDGKPAAMFPKDGQLHAAGVPAGYSIDPRNVTKIDTGTGTQIVGNSGNVITNVNKDIAGARVAAEVGDATGKAIAGLPKAGQALQSYEAQSGIVSQEIDKALSMADEGWATGLTGSLASKMPGTKAYDLRRTIDTLKANIGFDKLQQMRLESPSGGALGAVAVQELEMLQAVLGSIDQAQSKEQLKENLARLKVTINDFKARRQQAYADDVKRYGGAVVGPPNVPINANPSGQVFQPLDFGNGVKVNRRLD